jgi:hypothetical protein
MDSTEGLVGITKYLRRTKSKQDLKTLANQLFEIAQNEVIFVSGNFEGASGSAQVRSYDKAQVLNVVEDLITEMVRAEVTSWTEEQSAGNFTRLIRHTDRSSTVVTL